MQNKFFVVVISLAIVSILSVSVFALQSFDANKNKNSDKTNLIGIMKQHHKSMHGTDDFEEHMKAMHETEWKDNLSSMRKACGARMNDNKGLRGMHSNGMGNEMRGNNREMNGMHENNSGLNGMHSDGMMQ